MVHIRRRQLLAAAGSLLVAPYVRAKSRITEGVRTIGFLHAYSNRDPKRRPHRYPSAKALKKLGWIDGENIVSERRYADGNFERLAVLAQELVRKGVEVIWVDMAQSAIAARRVTQTIPIVFSNISWPVELGLVDSLARPGLNVTGTAYYADLGVSAKRLEFLREMVPAAKRLSQLVEPSRYETLTGGKIDIEGIWTTAAERLGFVTRLHLIRRGQDIGPALAEIKDWGADAIHGTGGPYMDADALYIAAFALRNRLPNLCVNPFIVRKGGLLSYAPASADVWSLYMRSFEYVDQILRGARPSELPVEQPSRFELTINTWAAKEIGLKIPQSLLLRADRLIEKWMFD
jgi:putative ABC transport system substrate-binding protein